MAVSLKPGTKFRSTTCSTEIVIVKGGGDVDLRCGGAEVVPAGTDVTEGTPAAPFDGGTLMGKRYATEDGALELLCTKPGAGSLSIGDAPLGLKDAKPLPASD